MDTLLTLQVPGYEEIGAPEGVPTGGLTEGSGILQNAITIIIVIGVVVALFMLIYSGIQWIMSGGDKEKLTAARHRIIYTIIGLVVIFLSFMIVNAIGRLFGVNLLGGTDGSGNSETKVIKERKPQRIGGPRESS